MKVISLTFVRLAVKRSRYPGHLVAAVSSPYHYTLNWDGTQLHGNVVIYDLSDRL